MEDEEYKPVARRQGPAANGNETLKGGKDAGLLFRHADFMVPSVELLETPKKSQSLGESFKSEPVEQRKLFISNCLKPILRFYNKVTKDVLCNHYVLKEDI